MMIGRGGGGGGGWGGGQPNARAHMPRASPRSWVGVWATTSNCLNSAERTVLCTKQALDLKVRTEYRREVDRKAAHLIRSAQ